VVISWLGLAYPGPAAVPIEVKVTRPARGEVVRYVTLPGTVRANRQVTLYAKTPGYLRAILVDRGEAVSQGALLAEIEAPELLVERIRYQAELNKTKAELAKAKADIEIAALEFDRLSKAQKQAADLVVTQSVDNARARFEVAKAAGGVAQANEEVAKANLERTETMLRYTRITAPFAGIITARFVDPGAFIPAATSGSAAPNAAIVTLMDFDTVRVQVPVTELEAPLIAKGQPVRVSVEGLPGRPPLEGSISRLAYVLDEATRTMLVEADFPNPMHELRPGMYASVKLGVDRHREVMTVPVEALVMEKSSAFVFLLSEGKAKKTPVKIGFNDGSKVELVSGATADASIILVGKMMVTDGQPVNAVEAR
jgi:RND family efflux transporter MFP subunit